MLRSRILHKMTGIMLAIMLVISLAGCGKDNKRTVPGDETKIIAVYEGGQVNEQEFNRYYYVDKYFNESLHEYYEQGDPDGFREQMLQTYISFRILSARADEDMRASTERDVEERVKEYEKQLKSNSDAKKAWESKSEQWGIRMDDIRGYLKLQATAVNYVRSLATEEKMKELYESTLATDPNAYTLATVRHVLVAFEPQGGEARTKEEALQRAREVKAKLDAGADFAEIAKEYSDDPGSSAQGGRYVSNPVSDWVEPFRQAVLALDIGEISEPVETEYGYHVILVEERKDQTYEEVKDLLQGQVVNQIYSDFMEDELPVLIQEIRLPTSEDGSEDAQDGADSGDESDKAG